MRLTERERNLGDDYIEAATERIGSAVLMYSNDRWADALFLAGVAVECTLRAYVSEQSKMLECGHDLRGLLRNAMPALERFVGEKKRNEIAAALGNVWTWWSNLHRYRSSSQIRAGYARRKLYRVFGGKGDLLKRAAQITLDEAQTIVNKGVFEWRRQLKGK